MANSSCLLVCTFLGNFLAPVSVAAHKVKNLDHGNKDEGHACD